MADDSSSIKVCFVALRAYGLLSDRQDVQHIGGAEVQQVRIARGLVERGYHVSFVTLDVGQTDGQNLDGLTVYRSYRREGGWPALRVIHPRASRVWSAMKRADADIYYQRTSDTLTGIVAAYCRRHRRRFVFAVGHDGDCDPALPFCPKLRERVPFRYGLKRAHAIVAQTSTQQRRLLKSFGMDSVVIPSCIEPTSGFEPSCEPEASAQADQLRLVWLGRFAPEKRLNLLLEVARRCGKIKFDVIGDGPNSASVNDLKTRAASLENVRLLGYLPHNQVARYYHNAAGLICTSSSEGFPNTFLEAWSCRVPVVTSFDPDGIVQRHHLGIVAHTAEGLADAARSICFDAELRTRLGSTAYDYYLANHTVGVVVDAYDRLFRRLIEDAPSLRSKGGAVSFSDMW